MPTATADTRIAEIERVLLGYERAYEAMDVSALASVMDVSPQLEKGLRAAFKGAKSYTIEYSGRVVEFEGESAAKVRVARQDTRDGSRLPAMKQTFVLERRGDAWRIVSTSFERER
jgi:ketosteroid isomerase-like protein